MNKVASDPHRIYLNDLVTLIDGIAKKRKSERPEINSKINWNLLALLCVYSASLGRAGARCFEVIGK